MRGKWGKIGEDWGNGGRLGKWGKYKYMKHSNLLLS